MRIERPASGETLNHGQPSVPLLPLVLPTLTHLDQLSTFATVDQLLDHARGRDVQPIQPRVVLTGQTACVFLPGEPGYDACLGWPALTEHAGAVQNMHSPRDPLGSAPLASPRVRTGKQKIAANHPPSWGTPGGSQCVKVRTLGLTAALGFA